MQQLLAVMRQHDEVSAEAGGSGAQEQQCCRRHLLQIADEDVLDTVLPFVNGVLLGYPFVYCVSAENVNRACSWLSTTDLLLCGYERSCSRTCLLNFCSSLSYYGCAVT